VRGGKTDAVLGEWVAHAHRYGKDAIGLDGAALRTELIETIERSRVIYTPLGAKLNEQDKMWRFPNGARLRFAYLERDSDAEAYQGHSYTRVYVEEIGNFPSSAPILKLMATSALEPACQSGSVRQAILAALGRDGLKPGILILHLWAGGLSVIERTGLERVYIPSRVADNKYLGGDYVQRLKGSGSEQIVKAWLEGDWTAIEGAFFAEWSNERHVVQPFAIPKDWLRFRAMDWGSASPFSVGWWAVVGDDYSLEMRSGLLRMQDGADDSARGMAGDVLRPASCFIPRGALVRYREWYGSSAPNVGLKLTAEEVALGVIARSASDVTEPNKDPYAYTIADPSMFAQDGGPSHAERMMRTGMAGIRPADNKRVPQKGAMGGWDMMRHRLKGDGERPMIYCFSTCVDSIRTIPVLQHDPDKPEDLNTHSDDHCADEWRYACMSRPYIPKPPNEKPKPTELIYEVRPDGRIVGNMSVMEIVQQRMKRKAREE
jgi:hypothetical protein